jgi:hypothetical protein
MKRRFIPCGVAAALLAFFGGESSGRAWDSGGHEIIAMIADGQLNPKARQAVVDCARQMSTSAVSYDSVTLGCWMDDLRASNLGLPDQGLFFTWHYIDLGIEPGDPMPSFQPGNDNEYQGDVVQALKRAFVVLRGGTDPYVKTKAMACALAMHLVGDIHQPLHASTHYFHTPGGWLHQDQGGNLEYVVNDPAGDSKFSLHNFWDEAWRATFDEATGRVVIDPQYQEQAGDHHAATVQPLAETLSHQPLPAGTSLKTDFEAWAWESHGISENFVYREITATESKKYCRLSSVYVARANAIARERLALAGARLAVLLNETLGADDPVPPPAAYPAGPPGHGYEASY